MLGVSGQWIVISLFGIIYFLSAALVLQGGLLELNPIATSDSFPSGTPASEAFFTEVGLKTAYNKYSSYIATNFKAAFLKGETVPQILAKHSLTNFHAANQRSNNSEDYKWEWQVKSVGENDGKEATRRNLEEVSNSLPGGKKLKNSNWNLPEGVPIDYVKLNDRPPGDYRDWVFATFKCKEEGCSIFTKESI